jgi:anti-sigma factor ChrR (cupin superfamily)
MNSSAEHNEQHFERVCLYALQVLSSSEAREVETQIAACPDCLREMETVRPVINSFISWPTDILRPSTSLWERLTRRISTETGQAPFVPPSQPERLEWEEPTPGIFVKILATDSDKRRVSMLVRLAPGTDYPPHCHAGVEELHLLHGELMIDDKKLVPGDHIKADTGTVDHRVWSETGCTCILLTSTEDKIL